MELKKKRSSARKGRTRKRAKRTSKYPWWAKFIFAAARKSFRWSPAKKEALRLARCTDPDSYEAYRCAGCLENKWHPKEGVQVDHIQPVIDPIVGFSTWDNYFNRMFCGAENLAVLCTSCHKQKTKLESAIRKNSRAEAK